MINNRDCFFYKKSDFINRLQDISPDSVCYIADTQQIYTHGRYFECNVTQDVVEQLIQNHGYLTAADLPVLTGGASPTPGEYVTGVSVGGHNINVQKGKLSEINVGTASKLETPRKIELSGDLSGSIMFDGSQDVTIETIVNNSTTADRLTTPRTISLSSQATGQVSFDGSGNVDIPVTVNELDSKNSNNQDLNNLVTLNGYGGNLFYGKGGNTSVNKPSGVDWFGLFSFKSASGNYTTQILGSKNRLYSRSNADTSLGSWNTIAYLTDNVASATKLQNTRTFIISDGTNSGTASNFDGTGNVTLRLPSTIHADIVGNITGDITGDITGNLHGNADTATKLQTGRNINGTLFDGTQNITTAQWGTTRNLTIGNSTKSVNGSSNVSWTLSEIGAVNKAGDTITGNLIISDGILRLSKVGSYIQGQLSNSDHWRIQGYSTETDSGYLDIGTYDNANEPITISQYGSGAGGADLARRATILDGSGNTQFPGTVTAPTFSGALSGNASTASKLATARTITLTGDATGSASFDGSANISIPVTIANDSHTHATSASSNATTNLTIIAGGTTATVADLYATYADQLRTARTISLTGDVTGSTSFNGTGNVSINATVANDSHEHNWIHASYNRSGGDVPPNYIGTQKLMCKMMSTNPESTDAGNGYCDWILMNAYTWSDVPYATAIGVKKASSASDLYAYIMSGPNSNDQTTWNRKELVTKDKLTWSNISDKPSSFTPSSHTHTISQISDLNASWDSLLKSDPKAYVTRWPSISEVTGKQNLVIRLNGGMTEGTNQFTYNGTAAKTLNITPSSIGASASGHTHTYVLRDITISDLNNTSRNFFGFWSNVDPNSPAGGRYGTALQVVANNATPGTNGAWSFQIVNDHKDLSSLYYRTGANSGYGSWYKFATTSYVDSSLTWNNINGKPSSFTPSSHTHPISQITNRGTLTFTGAATGSYDGSGNLTINIPEGGGGVADSVSWNNVTGKPDCYTPCEHGHVFADITFNNTGTNRQYLAGDGRFYTISYSEVSGTPDLSDYATESWVTEQINNASIGGGGGDGDTLYTTASGNTSNKIFLVGATTQTSSGVRTYSHDTVYVGTDGAVYSEGQKVATQSWVTSQISGTSTDITLNDIKNVWTGETLSLGQNSALYFTTSSSSTYTMTLLNYSTHSMLRLFNNGSETIKLDGSTGDVTVKGQINATNGFYETSDARLKNFKEDIKALDTVDKIPTKYFTWKEDENQESQIGTSAQEVEKLYPELVSKTEDDTLTVDYAKLSIIALAAIKELKAEIQSLKEEIKQLKSK